MNNTLHFRRATRDDVPEIVRLLSDDPLGRSRERYELPLPESYYRAFERIDRDPNNELVVVETDGAIIGTLQLTLLPCLSHQGGTRALVEAVRVDAQHRSGGIGRQLLEWAIARARAEGCYVVQLTTDKQRTDAHRFYERLGFAATHEGMKLSLREPQSEATTS